MDLNQENDDQETFLNVVETAQRLSVHENTVRNWVRDGILQSARVPGSRFHRFRKTEVDQLVQRRGSTVSSIRSERNTVGPELVDGSQLHYWAKTQRSKDLFPELIRRLLSTTPGVSELSMRASDGVNSPGWDGRANSDGRGSYLPTGVLALELGTGSNPKKKAQDEYDKRTRNPNDVVPAEASFIFVTPRRWSGSEAWVSERSKDTPWKQIRVIDADDIEGWLVETPTVHYWISEQLGRSPRNGETLDLWWHRFRARTKPALPASLFLAGREEFRANLMTSLEGTGTSTGVSASTKEEAVAFTFAALESSNELGQLGHLALVVHSREVWDRTVAQPGKMILLPTFAEPDLSAARQHGHQVIVPIGPYQFARSSSVIKLPPPGRQEAAAALESVEIPYDRAYRLAGLARRSMRSLIRDLAQDPAFGKPEWGKPPVASVFAPLVIAGSWTDSEADREIVAELAGKSWAELEVHLSEWKGSDDPPFVWSNREWHVASAQESMMILHTALSQSHLERWHEIAARILLESDPRLDLSPEDRPMAAIRGIQPNHSDVLRQGFARGIALLGSLEDETLSDGNTAADHARRIVRTVISAANGDDTGTTWRSLAGVLPAIAEGAPQTLLDLLHEELESTPAAIESMFCDNEQSSWLFSDSPHTGLLWALEGLCWSPDYFADAARALARLDELDPTGRLSNRPLNSLSGVLVHWIRHTGATAEQRQRVIEQICDRHDATGWKLLIALWPEDHATASPPHSPLFRDWRPDDQGVTIAEVLEHIHHLVTMAVKLASQSPVRWKVIVTHLGPLPPLERDRILLAIEEIVETDGLADAHKLDLWESLRNEVARHRTFASSRWSMSEEPLERMEVLASSIEPNHDPERFAYLFAWHPDLPGIDPFDHEAHTAELVRLRTEALNEVAASDISHLERLAARSPAPSQLGFALGEAAFDGLTPELLKWLDDAGPLGEVAAQWAGRRSFAGGSAWLQAMLENENADSFDRQLILALNSPPVPESWNTVQEFNSDLFGAYWERMSPMRVADENVEDAARELLAHDRPWAAMEALSLRAGDEKRSAQTLNTGFICEVLDATLTSDPKGQTQLQSLGYEVGRLLDYLDSQGVDDETLAKYEWQYFRLLEDYREPRALFNALGTDPKLFVDLVSRVYRGKNQSKRQHDEAETDFGQHAWWVLNGWKKLPGLRDDGTVDSEHLTSWVRESRRLLDEADRADIGDEQVGQVLAMSPVGTDGAWPAETVRELIDTIGSRSLETGFHVGLLNARGTTSRGIYDGGTQERSLAERYRNYAAQFSHVWPRAARVVRGIADDYDRDARREDQRASHSADVE